VRPSDPECTELVERARGGDRLASSVLASRARPFVLSIAFGVTGSAELAQDLAQEALTAAWSRLDQLRSPCQFHGWLREVTANTCLSHLRRRVLSACSLDDARSFADPLPSPLNAALARAEAREVRAALNLLPDANRDALLLHVVGGWTYDEIAARTGVSASTVDGRIRRAKAAMRKLMGRAARTFHGPEPRKWDGSE